MQDEFPALLAHELVRHEAQPALERVRALAPQVCLRDTGLWGDGWHELAQRLRARRETSRSC
jgi:hypothetical protein